MMTTEHLSTRIELNTINVASLRDEQCRMRDLTFSSMNDLEQELKKAQETIHHLVVGIGKRLDALEGGA